MKDFANNHLDTVLQKISVEKKLMGDFNVNLQKSDADNDTLAFLNNISSHFFTPYILQPTRLHSKSSIDNIYFNSLEYQSNSGNLLIEISDHLIQFLILEGLVKEVTLPEVGR